MSSYQRISLAYVFGSFTRRNSIRDIDIAIYAAPSLSFDEPLNLGSRIELGFPVDLVQLQDLDPSFRMKILRKGIPIVMKDRWLSYSLAAQAYSELHDVTIASENLRKHSFSGC